MGSATERLQTIREHLMECFDLADPPAESFVIADEHYVGRTFRWPDHRAVWFLEPNELKIYGPEGHLRTEAVDQLRGIGGQSENEGDDRAITLPMFAPEQNNTIETPVRRAA